MISKEKLENLKEQLEAIIEEMEDKGIEELSLRPSTYGIHSDFIGICGWNDGGYLELNCIDELDEWEGGDY